MVIKVQAVIVTKNIDYLVQPPHFTNEETALKKGGGFPRGHTATEKQS